MRQRSSAAMPEPILRVGSDARPKGQVALGWWRRECPACRIHRLICLLDGHGFTMDGLVRDVYRVPQGTSVFLADDVRTLKGLKEPARTGAGWYVNVVTLGSGAKIAFDRASQSRECLPGVPFSERLPGSHYRGIRSFLRVSPGYGYFIFGHEPLDRLQRASDVVSSGSVPRVLGDGDYS
jgi:hypothetical protein